MKQTQRLLTMIFWGNLAICVVIALLFETSTVKKEMLKDDVQLLFIVATVMQLFTLGIIPLALRLFKFKTVRTELTTGTEDERATAHATSADAPQPADLLPYRRGRLRLHGHHPRPEPVLRLPLHAAMHHRNGNPRRISNQL